MDLIALEAKYHCSCKTKCHNQVRAIKSSECEDDKDEVSHGIALANLVSYVKESNEDEDGAIFHLSCL